MKIFLIVMILFTKVFVMDLLGDNTRYQSAMKMLDIMNKNGFLDYHIKSQIKMEVTSNPLLALRQEEVTRFFGRELSFEKLKPELANIYVKELSVKEMQQFSAFFDTSVGQKMIAKMPRLIGLSSNLAQAKIESKLPELINMLMQRK